MKKLFYFLNLVYKKEKYLLAAIFILSILFSSVFLLFFRDVGPIEQRIPGPDYSSCYLPAAENLLKGNLVFQQVQGYVRCAVGYPLVILPAIIFSRISGINALDIIVIYNVLITAFAACFIFLFVRLAFNKNIAILSSFLWLSYPLSLWFIKNPNTEVPFTLFLFLDMWIFMLAVKNKKIWLFFIFGIVLGLAVLVRPIAVFLILFLIPSTLILTVKGKKIVSCLMLLAGFLVIVMPWILTASLSTGHFVLVSSTGPGSFLDGMDFALKVGKHGDRVYVPKDVKVVIEDAQKQNFNNEVSVFIFLLKEVQSRPVGLLKLLAIKAARSWYGTSELWLEKEIAIIQLPYLLSAAIGLFLIFKKYRDKIKIAVFILLIVLYFWLMTIVVLSIARYMIPVMGLIMIFSAVAINFVLDRLRIKQFLL